MDFVEAVIGFKEDFRREHHRASMVEEDFLGDCSVIYKYL